MCNGKRRRGDDKAVDNALPNGGLNVHICGFTPEQAIAATLGAGTCHDTHAFDSWGMFTCSNCGAIVRRNAVHVAHGEIDPQIRHCPNCGAEVVDE